MSLLDEARRLAHQTHSSVWNLGLAACWLCRSPIQDGSIQHTDACGLVTLPKIVAALEAAERMVYAMQPAQYAIPCRVICRVCHSEGEDWTHMDGCPWNGLKKALEA